MKTRGQVSATRASARERVADAIVTVWTDASFDGALLAAEAAIAAFVPPAPLVLLVNERIFARGEQLSAGGSTGKRMRRLVCGESHAEWPAGLETVAIFERGRLSAWALADIGTRRPRRLVLLGRKVAKEFGCNDLEWCRWVRLELPGGHCCAAIVVPHPSNANRGYNDPALREQVSAVLRRALQPPRGTPRKLGDGAEVDGEQSCTGARQ